MRRRWLPILGGVVVLGVITIFALALLVPRAPFRFLDGHEPLPNPRSDLGGQVLDYSFKADFGDLAKRAGEELPAPGYRRMEFFGHKGDKLPLGVVFHDPKLTIGIRIYKDSRLLPGKRSEFLARPGTNPGWVTVRIVIPGKLSLWDKVKAMFGLSEADISLDKPNSN